MKKLKYKTVAVVAVISLVLCSCTKMPKFDNIEWVNLGLPSGVMWAKSNLGASSPEEFGNFYAWGETQPKKVYNWSTYKYCNGDYNLLTKYCNDRWYFYQDTNDWLTRLEKEDDPISEYAFAVGGRTPTKEDWQELINNTTSKWITQNGVAGRLFTAANGNSIFLPAVGYCWGKTHYYDGTGSLGIYWSSSLDTDYPPNAGLFYVGKGDWYVSSGNRYYGFAIRPVK